LHGMSLDYGTRTNSFKAISLLNFLTHVVEPTPKAISA
jgi:hypothetical protein